MTEAKYYGLYSGEVVDNEDPESANRVKIHIPGLCEPTTWARPKGLFGSGLNFGIFGIPPMNSEVLVQFENGDIDSPWYEIANPAPGEIPEEFRNNFTKFGFSFGDIRIAFDVKESGLGSCKIYSSKYSEDNYIELDGETNSIKIKALTNIDIETFGILNINGGYVSIQNRPVSPGGKEI